MTSGTLIESGRADGALRACGDEYIVGQQAYAYRWEAGGAAVLGSIQPQPLNNQADGSLLLTEIEDSIKPDDSHYARTRLLALENTIGGKVLSQEYMEAATALARRHGFAKHLDGARIFNAATALDTPVATLTRSFDTGVRVFIGGLGSAGRLSAGRQCAVDREGATHAQDGGRRFAAGRHSRRGRALRAGAQRGASCRRPRQRSNAG